jgi:hypothetical protein
VTVSCERCNEPLGSIKGGEFLDQLATTSFSRRAMLNDVILIMIDLYPNHFCRLGSWSHER